MADDDTSTDETTETPKVEAEPSGRPPVDRRSLGLGALAVAALVLAFVAGMAVGGGHHDHDEHFEQMRDSGRGSMMRHRGGGGEQGMRGGNGMPGGMFGGRADERGGPMGGGGSMGRGGHGGAGVVESASANELTIAPLGGRIEQLTVTLDDDTRVTRRGGDGPRDVEQAKVSDIDEGDIVMAMGAPADGDGDENATIDAEHVVILRDGDE